MRCAHNLALVVAVIFSGWVSPAFSSPLTHVNGVGVARQTRTPPGDRTCYTDAYELLAAGRRDAALAAFEKAVELNPQNGSHLIQLGRLVSEVGDRRANQRTCSE
eukprot:2070739-Rhodomonas_salina.2